MADPTCDLNGAFKPTMKKPVERSGALKDAGVFRRECCLSVNRMIAMAHLRENIMWTVPIFVMAHLARKIGRGHNAIYHGTRHLPLVLSMEKLLLPRIGDRAVFLTRSPEIAAHWADTTLRGEEYCGGFWFSIEPHSSITIGLSHRATLAFVMSGKRAFGSVV